MGRGKIREEMKEELQVTSYKLQDASYELRVTSYKILVLFVLFCIFFISCGNRRSPTGGPIDRVAPEILYTYPLEYEQIENNEIEIAFSKTMDRNSVLNGIVITPSNINKRMSWRRGNLLIKFTDALPEDTNIHVYLNPSIRCDRGNTLTDHTYLTFRNGELQRYDFSGYITLDEEETLPLPTILTLLDKDSLLVLNRTTTENNYTFSFLNSGRYTLRAYMDKNNNNRFDYTIDPFYRADFELPVAELINLNLTVADTVKPNLRNILNPTNNNLIFSFNKELTQFPNITVSEDSTGTLVYILYKEMIETNLHLLTTALDTLKYNVVIEDLIDHRGNTRETVLSSFTSNATIDTKPPVITDTFPRNGNVVHELKPEIIIHFDEIMLADDVYISLYEVETNINIPLYYLNSAGFSIKYIPINELNGFSSYRLTVHGNTRDNAHNQMGDDVVIQFLIINPN